MAGAFKSPPMAPNRRFNPMELQDYGFGPMTQQTYEGYPNREMWGYQEPPSYLDYAAIPGGIIIDQAQTAGQSWSDAQDDPSLANLTKAGVDTGLAFGSPAILGGAALGGYGLAAASDLWPTLSGAFSTSSAEAGDSEMEALQRAYDQALADSKATVKGRSKEESANIRAKAGERATEIMNQMNTLVRERAKSKQDSELATYNAQTDFATKKRDEWLARDKKFSDTEVGKLTDKLGGLAPLAAGVTYGKLARLAKGKAKNAWEHASRAAGGGALGVTMANVPVGYDAIYTEPSNPTKQAYSEYGYLLPDTHPDKEKALTRAKGEPDANPIRTQATEDLFNSAKLAKRSAFGFLEGAGGAEVGQYLPDAIKTTLRAPAEVARNVGRIPGSFVSGVREGFAKREAGAERGYTMPSLSDKVVTAPAMALEGQLASEMKALPTPPSRKPRSLSAQGAPADALSGTVGAQPAKPRKSWWDRTISKFEHEQRVEDAMKEIEKQLPETKSEQRRRIIKDIVAANPDASGRDIAEMLRKYISEQKNSGTILSTALGAMIGTRAMQPPPGETK